MVVQGTLVIDGMRYAVEDVKLPKMGDDGIPTGEMVEAKKLVIIDAQNPAVQVHILMTAEQIEQMSQVLSGRTVHVPNANEMANLAAAARHNGGA